MRTWGLVLAAMALAGAAHAEAFRAWDGAALADPEIERALASDEVVVRLAPGERLDLFDQRLTAARPTRVLLALSSQFLTIAVTEGEAQLSVGPAARAGQALVIGLDQRQARQLAFDARRLDASLAPGARPLIGADLTRIERAQSRWAFFGVYEPVSINARSPGAPEAEWRRQGYLADPVVVRLRRGAAARNADPAQRTLAVADAFSTAVAEGDAQTMAALLDPSPFIAAGSPARGLAERSAAAQRLAADQGLRQALIGPVQSALSRDGVAVLLTTAAGRWRLGMVMRDGVPFVTGLEPAQ